MHCASTHLPTEHCVLRLSNLPFRHELAGAVGHGLNRAFSFSEVVAATSDTDLCGMMDVRGICGHKSVGSRSHRGCTEQLPEHCSFLFSLQSGLIAELPNNTGCVQSTRVIRMNFTRFRAIQM